MKQARLQIRNNLEATYRDVYTPEAMAAIAALAMFDDDRRAAMRARMQRRATRAAAKERITFLDESACIGRTEIKVKHAREGQFVGSEIPKDLQRQWIQGTGPGARPNAPVETSIRNVAYALLSGADGWMFDGEDALGQVTTMSLDNQRNLKLAIAKDPVFIRTAEQVASEMNTWGQGFLGQRIVDDLQQQLCFTTKLFRPRGLHLDDRHMRCNGRGFSASIVDTALYVVNNYQQLQRDGSSIVLYLPKIQTAEEAALWNDMLSALEARLGLQLGAIKTYVLVEQLEAAFQLMEIRAALGRHFVGFNTGRWDYINSVADAMAWDTHFVNPNIDAIGMTYAYMRNYEDRVRRAVNTPDQLGNFALWQGGMEPNIPVGSEAGVAASMQRALSGAEREQKAGASGKWVAHWKMVHIIRPVWAEVGHDNQLGREFPRLTYTQADARGLIELEDAPRTVRGARDLLSVALQYGNAFGQGYQAAALKPADFFGDGNVLYLMEDAATGEIRLSILWEWLHKRARLSADDVETGIKAGDEFSPKLFTRLLHEEYDKLVAANDKDVHEKSKKTTLPIARHIVSRYVEATIKAPWYIDLLNLNLNNHDLTRAKERVERYIEALSRDGHRITENVDFVGARSRHRTMEIDMESFEQRVSEVERWMQSERFAKILRLYTPRQVVEQRGTIETDYPVARKAAEQFYARLRELFSNRSSITTFAPYSPGQAVMMKRVGIEGIYLGGWATSAKGSVVEDPGPDLASYPLSQVPDEAAPIVRALLAQDRNQHFVRSRMAAADRKAHVPVDFRPFIIADADTGHGGEAHVRNLIRRFVESGVPGYHIEDQKPGVKKCGHQAGKVLVPQDEQNKRLNAARFQLDVMGVPGIIVARTDAEAATFLDGRNDERDQPFILGATNVDLPSCKVASLAILKRINQLGVEQINGHLLYEVSDAAYEQAFAWLKRSGVMSHLEQRISAFEKNQEPIIDPALDEITTRFLDTWQMEAGLKTFAEAVADAMRFHVDEGQRFDVGVDEWLDFASRVSFAEARDKAKSIGLNIIWDCELPKTPEGYYQIRGGIPYAIAKSLAAAPFADILWMETKTANLADAKQFADAIHAVYPDQMLAYNLSPSFNWDTTGMNDDQMKRFPEELGRLGFVFNFITYGGHQVDGLASEEFATALKEDGMLALARLQRKLRLVESPYKTPQSFVGGPRLDGALMATSGRTATTKAMGKGSTQFQHMIQTEVPAQVLTDWLQRWAEVHDVPGPVRAELRPHTAGSALLELSVVDESQRKLCNVIFATLQDRRDRNILSIRDQNTFDSALRRKRLMTLAHVFLIYRYKSVGVHYLTPTDDNDRQTQQMKKLGIFREVNTEVGQIIVAEINVDRIKVLVAPDRAELDKLITKQ